MYICKDKIMDFIVQKRSGLYSNKLKITGKIEIYRRKETKIRFINN